VVGVVAVVVVGVVAGAVVAGVVVGVRVGVVVGGAVVEVAAGPTVTVIVDVEVTPLSSAMAYDTGVVTPVKVDSGSKVITPVEVFTVYVP
jgi:hypothetical protein